MILIWHDTMRSCHIDLAAEPTWLELVLLLSPAHAHPCGGRRRSLLVELDVYWLLLARPGPAERECCHAATPWRHAERSVTWLALAAQLS